MDKDELKCSKSRSDKAEPILEKLRREKLDPS